MVAGLLMQKLSEGKAFVVLGVFVWLGFILFVSILLSASKHLFLHSVSHEDAQVTVSCYTGVRCVSTHCLVVGVLRGFVLFWFFAPLTFSCF